MGYEKYQNGNIFVVLKLQDDNCRVCIEFECIFQVWSNDKVVECTSTAFGTFGIVSEIYEPPSVEKDANWLLITKYIGYILSILLLSIFCIMVLLSKHLWEMFHIVGMNFAFALALADVFMIVSEQELVRNDHDACTFVGFGINLLYVAAAALLLFLSFAVFLATTSGTIWHLTIYNLTKKRKLLR